MPPKKKAANGYKLAEPLPVGTVLQDINKSSWTLGPAIGQGGFGQIYSAKRTDDKTDNYSHVIKIEPHSNGPLFVEINFYVRYAKPELIEEFKREKGIKSLGMPIYHGSGSLDQAGEKYRFLVMPKYTTDLYKIYTKNGKKFSVDTTFKIALQMLDVLEYIHKCGYVHADLKAANILLNEGQKRIQCYLVDFGLASKFTTAEIFKPNLKKAHDGTIEFLSRDAHKGVQTRRGDMEILVFNMLQWLGCVLPWEKQLGDPKVVALSKEEHMKNPENILKACFGSEPYPKALREFLAYLQTLNFNTEPDYTKVKNIFNNGVKEGGGSVNSGLSFSITSTASKKAKAPSRSTQKQSVNFGASTSKRQENGHPGGEKDQKSLAKKKVLNSKRVEPVIEDENDNFVEQNYTAGPNLRPRTNKVNYNLKKVPEHQTIDKPKKLVKKRNYKAVADYTSDSEIVEPNFITARKKYKRLSKSVENLADLQPPAGYTEAMKEVWQNKRDRELNRKKKVVKAPGASTSSAKRIKPTNKQPQFHGEVVRVEDSSQSD